ncbi:spondin domain-containing protein [Euzebya tangerina]|uniref:spondin domain-containing protein n=1 Tax=Euzebya tangerina TaxID=591198 RepID=UPI000E3132B1|nr:spondin domain-containing protein [Euzebya tangerina]
MKMPLVRRLTMLMVSLLALGSLALPALAQDDEITGYEITVENLTAGQPNTPPVYAFHDDAVSLFSVGDTATEGIAQVAENGNNTPLLEALDGIDAVQRAGVLTDGEDPRPIPAPDTPGEEMFASSLTTVLAPEVEADVISLVWMQICTNDGFSAANSVALPAAGETVTVDTIAYDAGTEVNTEDFADIVPPCQALTGLSSDDEGTGESNPDLAEGGVITPHPIIGAADADLDAVVHDTSGTVNRVTITALTAESGERTGSRLDGATRIETAIAISNRAFPDGADVVYLANADSFVDAVAGGTLTDGPVLLVPGDGDLPAIVDAEIDRVDPDEVIALGGVDAISNSILDAAIGS